MNAILERPQFFFKFLIRVLMWLASLLITKLFETVWNYLYWPMENLWLTPIQTLKSCQLRPFIDLWPYIKVIKIWGVARPHCLKLYKVLCLNQGSHQVGRCTQWVQGIVYMLTMKRNLKLLINLTRNSNKMCVALSCIIHVHVPVPQSKKKIKETSIFREKINC